MHWCLCKIRTSAIGTVAGENLSQCYHRHRHELPHSISEAWWIVSSHRLPIMTLFLGTLPIESCILTLMHDILYDTSLDRILLENSYLSARRRHPLSLCWSKASSDQSKQTKTSEEPVFHRFYLPGRVPHWARLSFPSLGEYYHTTAARFGLWWSYLSLDKHKTPPSFYVYGFICSCSQKSGLLYQMEHCP